MKIDANAAAINREDDRPGRAAPEVKRAKVISSGAIEAIAGADRDQDLDRDVKAAIRGHSIGNVPGFAVTNRRNAGNRWCHYQK